MSDSPSFIPIRSALLATGCLVAIALFPHPTDASDSHPNETLFAVEPIHDVLPFFDGQSPRDPVAEDEFPPMRVLLSRCRFWSQDLHLDVVIQLAPGETQLSKSKIEGRIIDDTDQELATFTFVPPSERFIIYPKIPENLMAGGAASLELRWTADDEVLAGEISDFRVEPAEVAADASGGIAIEVPNPQGAMGKAVPVTLGVPFPRGILESVDHLRLLDAESGDEISMQPSETARWSKFGSVKWVHLDFTVDLPGTARKLLLKYGPDVQRSGSGDNLTVEPTETFPEIDAGRLRFDAGLWFDPDGNGEYVKVLDQAGLHGAFVEHENGRMFQMPAVGDYEIEETGPEKVVLKREGWFEEVAGEGAFCQYVVRYVIHRDSPMLRIYYTWIFTGDGNRDRIRNMGWEFNLAEGLAPDGFLTGFDEEGEWVSGDFLLQHHHNAFDVLDGDTLTPYPEGRAPGVARATGDGVALYFGVKDFWQNYPSELEFQGGSLWFHNWPRHNRENRYEFDPGLLGESEFNLSVVQARFAHEGQVLDFRIPDVLAENPVWQTMSRGRESSSYWYEGEPESANAQGISRTEEMWLYLTAEDADDSGALVMLQALDDETLRAVADPAWVAASGAFYEMHQQDWENYPEAERIFELVALAPGNWIEWTEMYGMWNHGDLAAWGGISRTPSLYRARRKAHHGWPYSWVPYARSGDSRFLKLAEAATRQMIDASFCHYVDDDVRQAVGDHQDRRLGYWARSTLPWAGRPSGPSNRTYETNVDYLLHAWYLTGYHRAWDNFLTWADQTKVDSTPYPRGPRGSSATLKAWLEAYEATFDPWFLVVAHATAETHLKLYRDGHRGHFWQTGDREFMRYTDCADFREFYLAYAERFGDPRFGGGSWGRIGAPVVESQVFAWQLTDDDFHLQRAVHFVDWVKQAVYDGEEPAQARGNYMTGHSTPIFTGWALDYYPTALWALHRAGDDVAPIGPAIQLRPSRHAPMPGIVLRKEPDAALPIELTVRVVGEVRGSGADVGFTLAGPDGEEVRTGVWNTGETKRFEVEAGAPPGDYLLALDGGPVDVPVSDVGHPEVLVLKPGEEMPGAARENRFWFLVPEGVEHFEVRIFPGLPRSTIWDPDGNIAWDSAYHPSVHEEVEQWIAKIDVSPEYADRLWRITFPGHRGRGFRMDAQIPPVYALDPDRWFMPETLPEPNQEDPEEDN